MLLRASGEAIGRETDLQGAVGEGDGGVPHGEALLRFAEAATQGTPDLAQRGDALRAAVGREAFVEAAATVGIFNGLVRVADGTGIPLDAGMNRASRVFREELGLVAFPGARNTELESAVEDPPSRDLARLFGS